MRRLIWTAAGAMSILAGGFAAVSAAIRSGEVVTASSGECQKANVHPDSGRIELQYLRPSSQNAGHADYLITMTLRWDSDADLSCFDDGIKDWAYEHDVLYASTDFDRKLWNEDYSSFPGDAGAYTDTDVLNTSNATSLSFGIFRPERLKGGTLYRASYEVLLPSNPPDGLHPLTLEGEVLEKSCSEVGPWCVGLDQGPAARNRETFVGESRGFAATGDCWDWRRGSEPRRCAPTPVPTTAQQAPPTTSTPSTPPPTSPTTTADTAPPSSAPPTIAPSPPSTGAAPPSPPATRAVTVDNRVTNGATQMREDTPAYLSTVTRNYCKRDGCMVAGTDVLSSGSLVTAYCQVSGDRTTNGHDTSSIDDHNPGLFESRRWYGVRWSDGRTGYISEVWITASDRGGAGLPGC